jgi:hypothetical protein
MCLIDIGSKEILFSIRITESHGLDCERISWKGFNSFFYIISLPFNSSLLDAAFPELQVEGGADE